MRDEKQIYDGIMRTKSSYSKHLRGSGSIRCSIALGHNFIPLSSCDTDELLYHLCDLIEDGVDMFPDFCRGFVGLFVKGDIFGGNNVVQIRDGRCEVGECRSQRLRKSGRLSLQLLKLLKHGV